MKRERAAVIVCQLAMWACLFALLVRMGQRIKELERFTPHVEVTSKELEKP